MHSLELSFSISPCQFIRCWKLKIPNESLTIRVNHASHYHNIYHVYMQVSGFSEKPSSFLPAQKATNTWNLLGFLFAKAQCGVFHFQVSSSYSGKNKKSKKKRKTSYSSQYIIWTIFGTWKFFCEGKQSIELLVSLKKDFIFPSRYYYIISNHLYFFSFFLEIFCWFLIIALYY